MDCWSGWRACQLNKCVNWYWLHWQSQACQMRWYRWDVWSSIDATANHRLPSRIWTRSPSSATCKQKSKPPLHRRWHEEPAPLQHRQPLRVRPHQLVCEVMVSRGVNPNRHSVDNSETDFFLTFSFRRCPFMPPLGSIYLQKAKFIPSYTATYQ